jgi:CHAT domain-containing protein/tetratricopeptide (TPR) repeat protein
MKLAWDRRLGGWPVSLVRALGVAWAGCFPADQSASHATQPDGTVIAWLRALSEASPTAAADMVASAGPERTSSAARWLLGYSRSQLMPSGSAIDWPEIGQLGKLVLQIVDLGHGRDFPGGQIAAAHARMLMGLGSQLRQASAGDYYRQAEREYLSHNEQGFAALARLGVAAAGLIREAITANLTEERAGLLDFGALHSAAAQVRAVSGFDLEPVADTFTETLRRIAAVRGRLSGEVNDEAGLLRADEEAGRLFETAALANLDEPGTGLRLARLADDIYRRRGIRASVVAKVGRQLVQQRRWQDALVVLEECHGQDPADQDVAHALVTVYLELGRLDAARSLLVSMLPDRPGIQDLWTLQTLQNLAYRRDDPEYKHWERLVAELDSARTVAGQLPAAPAPPPRERLRASFRDGTLMIAPDLMELPEQDRTAHMTAAIIAGSPDGEKQFTDLVASNPALAERVAVLLGLRKVTAEESSVNAHIQAGEQHFGLREYEAAAREYEAALNIDPDNVGALTFLGDTWYCRGAYDTAQAYFEESISVMPTPQAYRFLGDAILRSGEGRQQARQCYQEALRLDPSYGGAKIALRQLDEGQEEPSWLGGPAASSKGRAPEDAGGTTVPSADQPAEPLDSAPQPQALRWSPSRTPDRMRAWRTRPAEELVPSAGQIGPAASPGQTRTGREDRQAPRLAGSSLPPDLPLAGSLPSTSPDEYGARLERAVLEQLGPASIAAVIDDDDAFERWVSAATPDHIANAIMIATMISYHYEAKDRNLPRWAHWVQREVQLAEALPAAFGPGQSATGIGRDRRLGEAYGHWGAVLRTQGRLAEARDWYERAVDRLDAERAAREQAGLFGETDFDRAFSSSAPGSSVLESLAEICHELGDDAAADRYATRARQLERDLPTDESQVDALVGSGDHWLRAGDVERALNCFHQAWQQAEAVVTTAVVPRALAQALNALGRCHGTLRLYRSALAYFDQARQLNERSENAVRLTWDYREIGRTFRARPDLGDARQALESSLINASRRSEVVGPLRWTARDGHSYQVTAADRAWETLLELGSYLEEGGDLTGAASFLTLATSVADVVWASTTDDSERIAVANQRIAAFAGLTRLGLRRALGPPPDPAAADDAWQASEAMRARSFLDALGDDELAVPAGMPPELVAREAAALERRRLTVSRGRGAAFWSDLERVQAELEDLWSRMLAATPSAGQYVELRRARPASAADTQQLIAADGRPTVIASVVPFGPGQLAVIAVRSDHDGPVVASQPADLSRLSRFIHENLGTAGRVRELATDLEDLFHHETEPLTKALAGVCDAGEVLVVCPFGALNYVPLAALRVDGAVLAERNPLAVMPNASLIRALRSAAGSAPSQPAMVFGDPTGDLPGARDEARLVGDLLGVEPVCGPAVTRAAVTAALESAGIVHVAAHAHFDADNPLSSGLRLADGLLTARDLITRSFPALSLVTLSACETGISLDNPAQELIGLTRALLFAGADSLLVSLWKVADSATVEMMSSFYGRLLRHMGKAEALQEAVLAARAHHGRQRFDRWAGFELIGEWR